MPGIVSQIMDFESGEMTMVETVEFFGELVSSGMAWTLQGSYGHTARQLIESGLLNEDGSIDWELLDE